MQLVMTIDDKRRYISVLHHYLNYFNAVTSPNYHYTVSTVYLHGDHYVYVFLILWFKKWYMLYPILCVGFQSITSVYPRLHKSLSTFSVLFSMSF